MNILKKHMGEVFLSVLTAVAGVAFSVIPYYAVADVIVKMISGDTDMRLYLTPVLLVLIGFIGNLIFHEISTLTSHNLAFRVIEDERIELIRKLERLSLGDVEKKSSGQWSQFVVETLDKLEQPISCDPGSFGKCHYSDCS
jgi:ATP-binding cassette subfamily B protein